VIWIVQINKVARRCCAAAVQESYSMWNSSKLPTTSNDSARHKGQVRQRILSLLLLPILAQSGCAWGSADQLLEVGTFKHEYVVDQNYVAVYRSLLHQAQSKWPTHLIVCEQWEDIHQTRIMLASENSGAAISAGVFGMPGVAQPGLADLRNVCILIQIDQVEPSRMKITTCARNEWYTETAEEIVKPIVGGT
jgi:hypothetical protein